jgi:acyl-CoA synthetase (AMP-forming)/AMP-acid ligase II
MPPPLPIPVSPTTKLRPRPAAAVESAVVGQKDEHWGETLRAHVVLVADAEIDAAELAAHVRSRLASYKVPAVWVFDSVLPKNAAGKILKRVLAELLPPN